MVVPHWPARPRGGLFSSSLTIYEDPCFKLSIHAGAHSQRRMQRVVIIWRNTIVCSPTKLCTVWWTSVGLEGQRGDSLFVRRVNTCVEEEAAEMENWLTFYGYHFTCVEPSGLVYQGRPSLWTVRDGLDWQTSHGPTFDERKWTAKISSLAQELSCHHPYLQPACVRAHTHTHTHTHTWCYTLRLDQAESYEMGWSYICEWVKYINDIHSITCRLRWV